MFFLPHLLVLKSGALFLALLLLLLLCFAFFLLFRVMEDEMLEEVVGGKVEVPQPEATSTSSLSRDDPGDQSGDGTGDQNKEKWSRGPT
jgi:hypothetical protein